MEKPPPSYQDTFFGPNAPSTSSTSTISNSKNDKSKNELESFRETSSSLLTSVFKAEIIPVPVMTQLLSSESEEESRTSTSPLKKKYQILDDENGNELLYGKDIRSTDIDLRGLSLIADNGIELLKCGYMYSLNFSTLEFSNPNGSSIGTFKRESFGLGLCGWFCLCFCYPMATAALKKPTGEPIFVCDAYLFPRKVDINRPDHLGGGKLGSLDVQGMNVDSVVKVSFERNASENDKILILGLGMAMMDYERVRQARGHNTFSAD